MRKHCPLIAVLALLALASLACQFTPVSSGGVLFQDDFSKKTGNWHTNQDDTGTTDYANNAFQIMINEDSTYRWTNPGDLSFKDVHIEVDASKAGGPDENDFGIICRYKDGENFYFFTISNMGDYAINKLKDGQESFIGMDDYQFDDTNIRTGDAANHIRADCVGSTLTLYVNGQQLIQVQDTDFTEGNVGLIAGSRNTAGVNINFDNFSVIKP